MSNNQNLCLVFIPSLIAILINKEREKGDVLTQKEVKTIRDKSNCMVMSIEEAEKMAESRGYDDIDPENAYAEYLEIRKEINNENEN